MGGAYAPPWVKSRGRCFAIPYGISDLPRRARGTARAGVAPVRYIATEDRPMEWTKPEFIEVNMDAEVGRYQQEDEGDDL